MKIGNANTKPPTKVGGSFYAWKCPLDTSYGMTIVALTMKIGNASIKPPQKCGGSFYACKCPLDTCGRHDDRFPVAVPDIFVGGGAPSSSVDRCHSLSSLYPPLAALASLPLTVEIRNENTRVKLKSLALFLCCKTR